MVARLTCLVVLACTLIFAFTSCIVASGEGWAIGALGTDADKLNVTSAGVNVDKLNQSRSLKIVADTVKKIWQAYLIEQGLEYLAGQYYTLEGTKVASSQAIELEKLANAKSVADAEAQLAILKATPVE